MAAYDPYGAPPRGSSQSALAKRLLPLLLIALIAVLIWRLWPSSLWNGIDPNAASRPVTPRGDLAEDEKSTIALFRQVSPSVVHITSMASRQNSFTMDSTQVPQGLGTGFIWDQDGHIVTNFHVIQGGNSAQVTLNDQSNWTARLVGAYPDKDIAVLLIDAPKDRLPPILVGSSHDLQVGQKAFAIGNPFGLDQTLTVGAVSAVGREIQSVTGRTIKDVVQTDAAINPGNSGGPLLDSAGRLIGVNTAIVSPSGAYSGIGFAIPVDEVNRIVPQLIKQGKVTRPGLGIYPIPDTLARRVGIRGVIIGEVRPDSPASKAGLRPIRRDPNEGVQIGDVILSIDGNEIATTNDLFDVMEQRKAGDEILLVILREGRKVEMRIVLEPLP